EFRRVLFRSRALVEHCCNLAEYSQALLQRSPLFEILSPRQLSIVCFRFVPPNFRSLKTSEVSAADESLDQLNLRLLDALRATGRVFISSTRLAGRVALRFCFVNWRTAAADVEEAVALLG